MATKEPKPNKPIEPTGTIKESPPTLRRMFTITDENNAFGNPISAKLRNQAAADRLRENRLEEEYEAQVEQVRQEKASKGATKTYAKGGRVTGYKGYGKAKKV
jgi:hypothetical protein